MSEFWKYFRDVLRWPLLHSPGPLQALVKGLAGTLDTTHSDIVYLRQQFFPGQCAPELVTDHGQSRGVTRHTKESPEQFRQRVVKAYPWHLLGGKTLGLPEILKFYGYPTLNIENMRDCNPSRWAEFQIGFKTPLTQAEQQAMLDSLTGLLWLVNEYKPARSFFFRMYTDAYDWRPVVLSHGPQLGEGWLSFFSGVPVEDSGNQDKDTIVSIGMWYRFQAKVYCFADVCATFGTTIHMGLLAPYLDVFTVGRSSLSGVYPRNNPFVIGSLFSILWADRATTPRRWRGQWDARSWRDYTGFDRKLPLWRMEKRSISKSQLVPSWPSDDGGLSHHNSKLGVSFATISNAPPRLGGFHLSAHDHQRQELCLHEFYIVPRGADTEALTPPDPFSGGAACYAISCPEQPAPRVGQAMHHALSLCIGFNLNGVVHSGGTHAVSLLSKPVAPAAAVPVLVRSFRIPRWEGKWNAAGRTWHSPQELF